MNKQLLEHYIEAYGTDIYSFCIRLTQNREQAEELYQDTFLAMCEKEDWKEEGNVKSYLLGITIKLWQNRMISASDFPVGSKSLPPFPLPMGSPVSAFLNVCSKARNFRMLRFTDEWNRIPPL